MSGSNPQVANHYSIWRGMWSIIKNDRFKMSPGFRLDEVGILSGWSM